MQIALIVNRAKPGASDCASTLQHLAAEAGVKVRTCADENLPEGFLDGCTVALAVGGDGTILGLVEAAVRSGVPLMGINFGKLGFMATFEAADAGEGFRKLIAGQCRETTRTLLKVRLANGRERLALNDVVIRTTSPRLLRLQVCDEGKLVNHHNADGLIFCTPSGSTAYNLSAGGPLLHPGARVLAMTPICPHTMSNRSFIFDEGAHLTVSLREMDDSVRVSVDGREVGGCELLPLEVGQSDQTLRVLEDPAVDYYQVVRRKLNWGELPGRG